MSLDDGLHNAEVQCLIRRTGKRGSFARSSRHDECGFAAWDRAHRTKSAPGHLDVLPGRSTNQQRAWEPVIQPSHQFGAIYFSCARMSAPPPRWSSKSRVQQVRAPVGHLDYIKCRYRLRTRGVKRRIVGSYFSHVRIDPGSRQLSHLTCSSSGHD
jgi:hypothetical protein